MSDKKDVWIIMKIATKTHVQLPMKPLTREEADKQIAELRTQYPKEEFKLKNIGGHLDFMRHSYQKLEEKEKRRRDRQK